MRAYPLHLALAIVAASAFCQSAPPDSISAHKFSSAEISSLRARAEKGDVSAQASLGKAYSTGNGVPQNDELAVSWYRKAADQDNAEAEDGLGTMYLLGLGVTKDKTEAARWYHRAAKLGNAQAMFNLGASYYNGDGVPDRMTTSYAWFLLAQEAGYPQASDAVRRSAEEGGRLGTPEALIEVGQMYEKGEDLPQSNANAAKWYRKAADTSPHAAVRLATLEIDGNGIPKNYADAMSLCKRAGNNFYPPGNFCVGYLYQHGLGTKVDDEEAVKAYKRASSSDFVPALTALAAMLSKGEGVPVDRPEAYFYYFRAARRGDSESKLQGQKLFHEMDKKEMKRLESELQPRYRPQEVFDFMEKPPAAAALDAPK